MAQHLGAIEDRLQIVGIYYPPPEGPYYTKAQQVAKRATEILAQAGISLPELLDTYRNKGLETLQDKLREALLGKLSGQPRVVLDQSLRATKLIAKFFVDESSKYVLSLIHI